MLSIASRDTAKKLAKKQAKVAATTGDMRNQSQYQLMLGKLRIDLNRLKKLKGTPVKNQLKKELADDYNSYIDGVLESKAYVQDDVLLYNMVWAIDYEDYDRALNIAEYAMKAEMNMPEKFSGEVYDRAAEYICNNLLSKDDIEPYLPVLQRIEALVEGKDMHDGVVVKINKSLGLAYQNTDITKAIEYLELVYNMDKRAGVKQLMDKLKKQL